jgi:hypothetical protein
MKGGIQQYHDHNTAHLRKTVVDKLNIRQVLYGNPNPQGYISYRHGDGIIRICKGKHCFPDSSVCSKNQNESKQGTKANSKQQTKNHQRCQSLNPYKRTKTTSKATYTIEESGWQQGHERWCRCLNKPAESALTTTLTEILYAEMGRILTASYGRGNLGISKRAQPRAKQQPKRAQLTNRFETTRGDQIGQPVSKNNRRKRDENEDQIEAESSCIAETCPSSTGTRREIPETTRKHLLERSVRRIHQFRKPQHQTPKNGGPNHRR